MEDRKYNGWTNYETWRVNLELFDDYLYSRDGEVPTENVNDLADMLKEEAEEYITNFGEFSHELLAVQYALAFLSAVNWYEIANSILDDYVENYAEIEVQE